MFRHFLPTLLTVLAVVACGSSASAALPEANSGAMVALPFPQTSTPNDVYRIGPLDLLNVSVFQVPDLTFEKLQVDAAGQIQLPLIGTIMAAGRTTAELAQEISVKLSEKYLQSPQVTVTVAEAASQKVTVDGSVVEPGVFVIRGRTTLLQAVAMAKGPDRTANLHRVAVFRTVNGQRMAAVFDLQAIRQAKAPDPEIRGDDIIVVEGSALKGAWREVIGALPALSIFRPF